jgi:hypothetical protein
LPPAFRVAIYENLIEEVIKDGQVLARCIAKKAAEAVGPPVLGPTGFERRVRH